MDPKLIAKSLKDYPFGSLVEIDELSPGYANRNYRLDMEKGTVLLRWVLEKDLHDLKAEIELLNTLRPLEFPAAYPIPKSNGSYVSEISSGYVVLYDFISGTHPNLGKSQAQTIGATVGRLNSINPPKTFRKSNTINMMNCLSLSDSLKSAANQIPDVFAYFIEETTLLSRELNLNLPMGLVHADVFPDNTLFEGERLNAIIDFEEVCYDVLLFDLAMTINGFCFPNNHLSHPLLKSLIIAYVGERPLSKAEWDNLAIYIQWTAHGMVSWHLLRLAKGHDDRQENRVRELMTRVKYLRAHQEDLIGTLQQIEASVLS